MAALNCSTTFVVEDSCYTVYDQSTCDSAPDKGVLCGHHVMRKSVLIMGFSHTGSVNARKQHARGLNNLLQG